MMYTYKWKDRYIQIIDNDLEKPIGEGLQGT